MSENTLYYMFQYQCYYTRYTATVIEVSIELNAGKSWKYKKRSQFYRILYESLSQYLNLISWWSYHFDPTLDTKCLIWICWERWADKCRWLKIQTCILQCSLSFHTAFRRASSRDWRTYNYFLKSIIKILHILQKPVSIHFVRIRSPVHWRR